MSDFASNWNDPKTPSPEEEAWQRNRIRIRVFLVIFLVGVILSFIISFARPPVFESTARILLRPPSNNLTEAADTLSRRQVAIQREVITTGPVMAMTREALNDVLRRQSGDQNVDALLAAFRVTESGDSGVLLLGVEASTPSSPAIAVESWIKSYETYLAMIQDEAADGANAEITAQLSEIEELVFEKRAALVEFRRVSGIVSIERTENNAMARMNGLTLALDDARAAEVTAKARLQSYQEAIAAGRRISRPEDARSLVDLERRASELRSQMQALELKFTANYIALDPDAQVLVRQLDLAESELTEARRRAAGEALEEAERQYSQAERTRRQLESDHSEARAEAAVFTSRFAEHEALVAELTQLETRQRVLMADALEQDIDRRKDFVELTILENASRSTEPVRPRYWRDAILGSLVSLVVALLAVALFEFIIRPIAVRRGLIPLPMPYDIRNHALQEQSRPMEGELLAGSTRPAGIEDQSGTEPPSGANTKDQTEE